MLVAPADSKVLSIAEVKDDSVFLVKNRTYGFSELITGKRQISTNEELVNRMKTNKDNKLYSVVFYLSPGDYHRYHSPADLVIKQRIHIAGYLVPVKTSYVENNDVIFFC